MIFFAFGSYFHHILDCYSPGEVFLFLSSTYSSEKTPKTGRTAS